MEEDWILPNKLVQLDFKIGGWKINEVILAPKRPNTLA